jgi:hypothetical protein
MTPKTDFFFKNIKSDAPVIGASDLNNISLEIDSNFFAYQVNRMLRNSVDNTCTVICSSSMPRVFNTISALSEQIGLVHVYALKPIDSVLNATLACDLFLPEGILSIQPQWNTSQEKDIVNVAATLAAPLILNGLHLKSFVKNDDGVKRLYVNGKHMLDELIALGRYNPSNFAPNEYGKYIANAEKAFGLGGNQEAILKAYSELNEAF